MSYDDANLMTHISWYTRRGVDIHFIFILAWLFIWCKGCVCACVRVCGAYIFVWALKQVFIHLFFIPLVENPEEISK